MKNLLFIGLFLSFTLTLKSQSGMDYCWHLQNQIPQGNSLNDVFFIDETTGWVVSENKNIYKSTDGGASWQAQASGALFELNAIYFLNSQVGWAVGGYGTILKTTNGGASWQSQWSGTTYDLHDIQFSNSPSERGFAVGDNCTILKTVLGWAWEEVEGECLWGVHLNAVCFINDVFGLAVGDDGTILRDDGLQDWQVQISGTFLRLNDVFFINSTTGWVVGDYGTIRKTVNSGTNWQTQFSETSYNLYAVHFTNNQTGWAVGDDGTILYTSDGGENWQQQPSGTSNSLYAVHFADNQTGWAVGDYGTILKYEGVPFPTAAFTWSTQGGSVQFTSSSTNATTFFWDFGDGQTSDAENPQHTYAVNGDYLVQLTATNVCGSTSTYEQTISITSGVSDPGFMKEFRLYPNPAGDFFTLSLKGDPQKTVLVDFFSSTGQKIFSESLDFQSGVALKNYSCRDWPSGMYWVRVSDEKSRAFQKIVIE